MRVVRTWGLGLGASIAPCVALCVALCGTATVALGQAPITYPECTKKPTPADVEGAKGAHKAASQFYERAEYDKAIRYWNDAYSFDCTANDLLVNVANAYEKLGDVPSTVATLEAYLKRTGPNATIELKVQNLRLRMAMVAAAATATPTAAPVATIAPTASAPPPVAPPQRPYGSTPLVLAGVGGAVALVGLILTPVGYSTISSAEKTCPDRMCSSAGPISKGNRGRAEVGAGWTTLGVGIAAVGGGMVWQLLYNKPHAGAAGAKTGMWVTPTAGPSAGGALLGGDF